jgi:hypothetical protein
MYLVKQAMAGHKLPSTLPPNFIPPSLRKPDVPAGLEATGSEKSDGQIDLMSLSDNSDVFSIPQSTSLQSVTKSPNILPQTTVASLPPTASISASGPSFGSFTSLVNDDLSSELSKAKSGLSELEKQMEALAPLQEDLRVKRAANEAEIREVNLKRQELTLKLSQAGASYEAEKSFLKEGEATLERERGLLELGKQEVFQAEQFVQSKRLEKEQLLAAIQAAKDELEDCNSKLEKMRVESQQYQSEIDTMKVHFAELNTDLKKQTNMASINQQVLIAAQDEYAQLKSGIQRDEEKLAVEKKRVIQLQNQINVQSAIIEKEKARLSALNSSLTETTALANQLTTELNSSTNQITILTNTVAPQPITQQQQQLQPSTQQQSSLPRQKPPAPKPPPSKSPLSSELSPKANGTQPPAISPVLPTSAVPAVVPSSFVSGIDTSSASDAKENASLKSDVSSLVSTSSNPIASNANTNSSFSNLNMIPPKSTVATEAPPPIPPLSTKPRSGTVQSLDALNTDSARGLDSDEANREAVVATESAVSGAVSDEMNKIVKDKSGAFIDLSIPISNPQVDLVQNEKLISTMSLNSAAPVSKLADIDVDFENAFKIDSNQPAVSAPPTLSLLPNKSKNETTMAFDSTFGIAPSQLPSDAFSNAFNELDAAFASPADSSLGNVNQPASVTVAAFDEAFTSTFGEVASSNTNAIAGFEGSFENFLKESGAAKPIDTTDVDFDSAFNSGLKAEVESNGKTTGNTDDFFSFDEAFGGSGEKSKAKQQKVEEDVAPEVKQLVGMGFSKEKSIEALEKSGFDVSKASEILLSE